MKNAMLQALFGVEVLGHAKALEGDSSKFRETLGVLMSEMGFEEAVLSARALET